MGETRARRARGARFALLPLAAALLVFVAAPGIGPRSDAGAGRRAGADAHGYGRVPLSFEPNRGQSDRRVRFLSRGNGYALFLTRREAVLALRQPHRPRARAAVLRLQFLGARRSARLAGVEPLASRVNYFYGRDPSRWRRNVPTFAKVRYRGLYRGVDLVLYGNQRRLEYDFLVAPGTDPGVIALRFRGARRLRVDRQGDLLVRLAGRTLRQRRPVVYQQVGPRRVVVPARYHLDGSTVRFRIGSYDRQRPLVIDPVLPFYATYLGGSEGDGGTAIDVDSAGNAYVAGWTFSADFPLSSPLQGGPGGRDSGWCSWADPCPDAFVAKMNAAGTELAYSTFIGSDRADRALGIDVDVDGNAYVTGGSTSEDFPTVNAWRYDGRWGDAFVLKLDPSGSRMLYSTWIGAKEGRGIAVDASGAAYVAGLAGANVPTTPGALKEACLDCRDVGFVTKLAPSGSSLLYSTYLGGDDQLGSEANDIAIDSAGNAYVTGTTYWHDFPTTPQAFDGQYEGYGDAYVAKLDPSGSGLVYATLLGGGWTDVGKGIAVDSTGHAYVAGWTRSTDFPVTAGARSISCNGYGERYCQYFDAFVTKLAPDGSALRYSTFFGGSADDGANDLVLDGAGRLYVIGATESVDFPIAHAFQPDERGEGCSGEPYTVCYDAFATRFNPDWSLDWSTYVGGDSAHDGTDSGAGIAVDSAGSAYVTGWTSAVDFPAESPIDPTCGTSGDGVCDQEAGDAFVAKLAFVSPTGACSLAGSVLSVAVPLNGAVTVSRSGSDIVVSGAGACPNATVTNVATINVVAGAGDEAVTLDLAGGPFAPGERRELDGGSEIKFTVSLGAGVDELAVRGGPGDDRVGGLWTGGVDLTDDGDADVTRSDAEQTTFAGGGGADTVYAAGYPKPVEIDGGDGADVLYGGYRADSLAGGPGNDTLDGWSADDTVDGGDGDDTLLGGAGDDVLRGGAGDDLFQAAADYGADVFQGGSGVDTASYAGADWRVLAQIDDVPKDAGEGDDIRTDVEDLYGGAARDELVGSAAGNVIQGGPGNDHLEGRVGADHLLARDGVADTVVCGGDSDEAIVDAVDEVSVDCEAVQRDGVAPGAKPPPNDLFAHARPLSTLEWDVEATNGGATKEVGEPNHAGVAGGASVWYGWTSASGGVTTVDVSASGFDPVLAAYTGAGVSGLTEVASNDESGPNASRVRFRAAAGAVYYLAVDGERGETGDFRIRASLGAASPVNDFFDDAIVLNGESGAFAGTTAGASIEPGEPNASSASLWWRVHATQNTTLVLETGRSAVRPAVAVYRGAAVSALTQLPDQSGTTSHSYALTAGTTYHVQVAAGTVGNFAIDWRLGPPVNDDLANARWMDYPETIVSDANGGATKQPGEPAHAGVTGGASIWFRWTAPASDTAYIWTSGSSFDTVLAVYTGTAVGSLTEVASNDDHPALTGGASRVSFTTTRGRIYYVAVDGKEGAAGLVSLHWELQSYACSCMFRDHISEPQVISGPAGSANFGNNVGDGKDGGEPDHAGNGGGASVWYRWQAPAAGQTTIETAGSTFDTLLAVYTGGDLLPYYSGLQLVAANDDAASVRTSRVTFQAQGGTTYWIAVDGKSNGIDVATGDTALQWSLARDPAAPSVELTSPAAGATVAGVVPLTANASDDVGVTRVEFLVNGTTAFVDRTPPYAVSWDTNAYPYPSGPTTLAARAYDGSGNVTESQPRGVTVANAPETTIVRAPPSVTDSPNASLGFSARDGSTFACSLDAGPWTACSYSAEYNGLAEGAHTFRVRATYGGSTDPSPATWRWTVLRASNDAFAASKALVGASGSVDGTVLGATKEPGEPNHGGVAGGSSVWYRWAAPTSRRVRIDTMGSLFDTALGVYTGTSLAGLQLVGDDDDGGGAGRSKVVFDAVAGTTYYVAVDAAWSTAYSALFRLNWGAYTDSPRPPNDDFAAAEPVSGATGAVAGANGGATKQAGEPHWIAGWLGGASVWYRWTAPANGPVAFTTAGSRFDSVLGVYTGSALTELALVGEDEEIFDEGATVQFDAVAGTTYRILVDGKGAATGAVALSWRLGQSPPPNDAFAAATAVSGASGGVMGTNVAATDEYQEPFHAGNPGGASIWYSWTAPQTGTATFDTEGSDFDTVLAVYTGDALYQLVERASDDDSGEGSTSRATFVAVAGHTYRIAVDGYRRSTEPPQGAVQLKWRTGALPADRSAPSAALTQPAPDALLRGTVELAATAGDDLAVQRVDFLADGAVIGSDSTEPYTLTWDSATVASGRTTLAARAVDIVGKTTTTGRSVMVDNTPPDTTVTAGPANGSTTPNPSFTFVSSERAYFFQCRLDGSDWGDCSSPTRYYSLVPGTHTFEVRAFDRTWQYDATPAQWTWTLAAAAPPANDNFASATVFSSPVAATTAGATREAGEPNHADTVAGGGKSVWYRWTGDGSAVTVDLVADFPGGVVAVYTGATVSSLGQVAKADGRWGYPARLTFTSTAGTVYRIAVDGGLASGDFRLAWSSHDIVPPDTSITSGPPVETTSGSATFSFTASDAGSTFECSLDDGAWAACTSPRTYGGLAAGEHVFRVSATDPAGNRDASPARQGWVVVADTTPPETTITAAPQLTTAATWAWLDFSADEWGATFACALDGAAFAPCTSPRGYVDLAPGTHTFFVRAADAAGNVDQSPAAVTWIVESGPAPPDTTPPETTIDSGPSGRTGSASAAFVFSSEPGAGFECALDGAAFTPCVSPASYSGLGDGDHSFEVRARDAAGNVDPTPARRTWTVDTTPPDTVITAGPTGVVATASGSFTFTSEPQAGFECSLDGAAFAACSSPAGFSALPDGPHSFRVRAHDLAGNTDGTPAERTWTVDTTAPETTIDSGPPSSTESTEAIFEFSADDPTAGFECSLDTSPFAACSSPAHYTALLPGEHRFRVRARDSVGNRDLSPASRTWTVVSPPPPPPPPPPLPPPPPPPPPPDTTPPETSIAAGPPARTAATDAEFAFSANEPGSTFECSLDSAAFAACTSPRTLSGLADGEHLFEVRARDPAGNLDTTPAARSWTVDTQAPETVLDEAPAGVVASASARFSFYSEPGAAFECSLDGAPFATCASPVDRTGLLDGQHSFRVRATDDLGNVDSTPARADWVVDTRAPDTAIGDAPPENTESTAARFTFAADEPGVFECSLDGSAFTACASPAEYPALAAGPHTFRVRARDLAGNVDGTPASRAWTIVPAAPPAPPPPGAPPPPTPAPPSPPPPVVPRRLTATATIVAGTVFVSGRGVARVPVACTGSRTRVCRGRLSLVHSSVASGRRVTLTLATRPFTIATGRRVALAVRLDGRARHLLARRGKLPIRVVVSWRDNGRTRTTSRTVKLELLPRR